MYSEPSDLSAGDNFHTVSTCKTCSASNTTTSIRFLPEGAPLLAPCTACALSEYVAPPPGYADNGPPPLLRRQQVISCIHESELPNPLREERMLELRRQQAVALELQEKAANAPAVAPVVSRR
jgi:hypothetical protein